MQVCGFNWQAVEAIGVWVGAGGAILAFVAAWQSLRAASAQAAAASRQVEALSRPFVVLPCSDRTPSDMAAWLVDVIPAEIAGDRPSLVNVGSGPALNLTWSFDRHPDKVIRGQLASLKVGGTFHFGIPVELGTGPKQITCAYSSANGVRYRSTMTLEDRNVIRCDVTEI